jgi:hypothetical protein
VDGIFSCDNCANRLYCTKCAKVQLIECENDGCKLKFCMHFCSVEGCIHFCAGCDRVFCETCAFKQSEDDSSSSDDGDEEHDEEHDDESKADGSEAQSDEGQDDAVDSGEESDFGFYCPSCSREKTKQHGAERDE